MHALRTRAACVALRSRPMTLRPSRSYASDNHDHDQDQEQVHYEYHDYHDYHDHHDHHHEPPGVDEQLGASFYVLATAVPAGALGYWITRPGKDGGPSSLTKWLRGFDYFNDWEARNTLRTNILEQAAHDKHLLMNGGKSMHVELKMPELLNSGSPWSVPAGHYANIDYLTEHYRKQAAEEEERKAKKLLAKKEQS